MECLKGEKQELTKKLKPDIIRIKKAGNGGARKRIRKVKILYKIILEI